MNRFVFRAVPARPTFVLFALPLLLLLGPLSLRAQEFSTQLSPVFKAEREKNYDNVIRVGNEYLELEHVDLKMQMAFTFKLYKAKHGVTLYRYSNDMKLLQKAVLFDGKRHCGPVPSTLVTINYKPYLVYPQIEEDKPVQLMIAAIDMQTLSIGAAKELMQIDVANVGLSKAMTFMSRNHISWKASPDKSKILWFWSTGISNTYQYTVTDGDLNVLRSKNETVEDGKNIEVMSSAIDNSGNVVCSYQPQPDKDRYIQRIDISSDKKRKTINVQLPQGMPYQTLIVPSAKGEWLHVAGTVANEKDFLDQFFYQRLTPATGRLSTARLTALSAELVRHLDKVDKGGWGSSKENKFGLYGLSFKGYEMEDGDLSMIGEFTQSRRGERASFFISGSMLNVRFKNNNAVVGYIPKFRTSAGSTIGSSYYALPYKNQLLIFYNDRAENAARPIMEKFEGSSKYNDVALLVAYMDAEGNVQRKVLTDLSEESFLPVGEAAHQFQPASLLFPLKKIKGLGGIAEESRWLTLAIQ